MSFLFKRLLFRIDILLVLLYAKQKREKLQVEDLQVKGIVLTAPLTEEIEDVVHLIEDYLAPRGCNLIVLQVRYRYQFRRHPEVWGYDPLSKQDVKKLLAACKRSNIKLIPKMNLLGHQSGFPNTPTDGILHGHSEIVSDIRDGLLRAYPDLDEQRGTEAIYYARSLSVSNPATKVLVFELIDELMEVFEADAIHIGCDEAFHMGQCPLCKQKTRVALFADWVNAINAHVRERGGKVLMWGDRLLSSAETGYDKWESADDELSAVIDRISRDVLICDWHYKLRTGYPSVDLLGANGFSMLVCPWRDLAGAKAFLAYAKKHNSGHVRGFLLTTWCGSGDLARRLLYDEKGRWQHTEEIASTIDAIL